MQRLTLMILLALALGALPGCQASKPPKPDDALAWTQEPMPAATNGAIYQAGREVILAENPVAHHIGDIVTIVLNEQTAAQKSATTSTSKDTTVTLPAPTIIGKGVTIKGVPILDNSMNNATKFQGQGASAESNSLTGYLTATVLKVLPNGNLFIAGEKQIGLNQGNEYVRVTGVVRPIDLAADDSIPSFRVASAHITYSGKGAINDANAQSWLARFFNSPWAPF
jgi:flagellar L-ring protein precursor FlgH